MKTLILSDYQAAVVNLALRQFSTNQLQQAIAHYGDGDRIKGESCEANAKTSSEVADKIKE